MLVSTGQWLQLLNGISDSGGGGGNYRLTLNTSAMAWAPRCRAKCKSSLCVDTGSRSECRSGEELRAHQSTPERGCNAKRIRSTQHKTRHDKRGEGSAQQYTFTSRRKRDRTREWRRPSRAPCSPSASACRRRHRCRCQRHGTARPSRSAPAPAPGDAALTRTPGASPESGSGTGSG